MDEQDQSFDPRQWVQPPPYTARENVASPGQTTGLAAHAKRRMVIAMAASVSLFACGLAAAWLTRDPEPSKHANAHVIMASIPDDVALSQRIVNLDGAAELEGALVANGIAPVEATRVARAARVALGSRNEKMRVTIVIDTSHGSRRLTLMNAFFADSAGVKVARKPDGAFVTTTVKASLRSDIVFRRGEMNDTDFYSSAVAAGITDSLIQTFAQAFAYDFNFQTEIRAGDVFEAAFEQRVNNNDEPVGAPHLLYAAFLTSSKSKALYRFAPPGEAEQWFDGYGRSVRRSFMRTPVDGARITSHFGMRFHPVLHYTRLHGGTDFAAPIGTPIYATAAGTVTTASPSACAGNMVIVKHDNGWETRYFHMEHYAPDIRVGKRVEQGHELGVIGVTGICTTGPHLHYEVHINGEKIDPETIPTEEGKKLEGAVLAEFLKQRNRIDTTRASKAN